MPAPVPAGPGPATRWVTAPKVVTVLFLAVQVSVPLWRLAGPRPARFAWHMYSTRLPAVELAVLDADGGRSVVPLEAYSPILRGEIDYAALLPPHLCRVHPGAAAIDIREHHGGSTRTVACR